MKVPVNQCPRCHVDLHPIEHAGVIIEICDQCGGEWLNAGELKQILDNAAQRAEWGAEKSIDATHDQAFSASPDTEAPVICPVCDIPTKRMLFGGQAGVTLDRCEKCGGIWLDRGELDEMEKFVESALNDLSPENAERFARAMEQLEMDTPDPDGLVSRGKNLFNALLLWTLLYP